MRFAVCSLAAIVVSLPALAQTPGPTSGVAPPARSFALEEAPTALTGNPAGLAFQQGLELDWVHDTSFQSSRPSGHGLFLGAGGGPLAGAASLEWLQRGGVCDFTSPCPRRLSLGAALNLGAFALGASYHSFSSSESVEVDKLSSWDLGLLMRPARGIALGFTVQDVNAPQVGLLQVPRRYVGSIGLRPLGEIATIGLDAAVRSCISGPSPDAQPCGASHPDTFVTLDSEVVTGLHFIGQLGLEDTFETHAGHLSGQVGLQLDLAHVGVRYAPSFREERGPRSSFEVRLSSARFPALSLNPGHATLIDLDRALEHEKGGPLELVFGRRTQDPLARTLRLMRNLAEDSSVKAVAFQAGELPLGMGRAEELRSGIEGLRAAGKKVLFYLENAGDLEYYVASAADRVLVAPQAALQINGFSATAIFAAAGLDKLGVKAEFFRVGAYKNAPDLFTRSDMSSEQREVQNSLLDDLYGRYTREVSERRHLEVAKLKALLDRGLIKPQDAVKEGLVDGLSYPDELEAEVGKLLGSKVSLAKAGLDVPHERETKWAAPPRISVVRVEGDIFQGEGGRDPLGAVHVAGAAPIVRRIREAADDPEVAAIVVRIDSPGGDGNASDLIWRELVRARKEKGKPVIASMGDVAASGGYYVAAGADEVFAEPSTVTGSIGVFIGHFDAEELFGKLGLAMSTVKRGESADLFSTARDLTDPERKMMQSWVDGFYDTFLERVSQARGMSKEQVDNIARGRVWSGSQALERKLVDHLGGLSDAIAAARKKAHVQIDDAVQIDDDLPLEVNVTSLALDSALPASSLPRSVLTHAARAVQLLGEPGTVRARLPYDLEVR